MNYDLAVMALEGMTRAPITIRAAANEVTIEGSAPSLKELARLFLLIAGEHEEDDAIELQPGTHVTSQSPRLRIQVRE